MPDRPLPCYSCYLYTYICIFMQIYMIVLHKHTYVYKHKSTLRNDHALTLPEFAVERSA